MSQSFSRCRRHLPTLLTYVALSTRGLKSWRPDAVMGCRASGLKGLGLTLNPGPPNQTKALASVGPGFRVRVVGP